MRTFYENSRYIDRVETTAHLRLVDECYIVNLIKDKVVLELGCGASPQSHLGRLYIGIDISFQALKKASDTGNKIQAEMANIPLKNDSVEALLTIAALEHTFQLEKVMFEIIRILKKEGIVIHKDAWNVPRWRSSGLSIKPLSKLGFKHKIIKLLIPILETLPMRAIRIIPSRIFREMKFKIKHYKIDFKELQPNYSLPEVSDADACSQIDSHSVALFYKSHGFKLIKPKDKILNRLFHRGVLISKKDSA